MPNLINDVEGFIRGVSTSVSDAPKVVRVAGDVAERAFQDAYRIESVGQGAVDAAATSGAAEAALGISRMNLILSFVPVAIFMQQCYNILYKITDHMPWMFGKIAKAMLFSIIPMQTVVAQIADNIESQTHTILKHHQRLWNYSNQQAILQAATSPQPHPTTKIPTGSYVTAATFRNTITFMERQIRTLEYALGVEQHSNNIPVQVTQSLHTVQTDVQRLQGELDSLNGKTDATNATVLSVQHQLSSLSNEIHGLRAVSAGWQDVQADIEAQVTTLTQLYNRSQLEVHKLQRQLTQLAPLALLLSAGATGIKTLRQLEDTPCMCPKFGNIPNELGTALAIMEFVENG
jgi:hypothetical protein